MLTELQDPPQTFPETCPQAGPKAGQYLYRDAEFWTCGFFPGNLYCLLERSIKYPQAFLTQVGGDVDLRERLRSEFLSVCRRWAEPLHDMSNRKDTHDIGFIIEPALRRDFELTGDARSLATILNAAESLASRYSETTKAIRSWDRFVNNGNNYVDKDSDFLLIIDSLCSKSAWNDLVRKVCSLTVFQTWICCTMPATTLPPSDWLTLRPLTRTPSARRICDRSQLLRVPNTRPSRRAT